MLDHLTLRVHDLKASKAFYVATLKPLGYAIVTEFPEGLGMGVGGKPDLWLVQDPAASPQHVAFAAPSRPAVDAFHAAGLAAGGRDNGAPGLRAHYHPNYYGAFIDDPSGHHMEAVIHTAPGAAKRPAGKAAGKAPGKKVAAKKAAGRAPSKKASAKAAPKKASRARRR